MNRVKIAHTCAAADTDGLANATVCTGAGPWVPNVATTMGDGLAHLVTITQAGATNHSAKTATISGTDVNGGAKSETINLPNGAATVTTTGYFASVTSVAISATIGTDTMTMGWAVGAISRWYQNEVGLPMGFGCTVTSGTPTFTVQYSYDGEAAFDHEDVTSATANTAAALSNPFQAVRLKWAAAGGVRFTGLQY